MHGGRSVALIGLLLVPFAGKSSFDHAVRAGQE